MDTHKEIGIEKILRDELIDNYIFRYELFECLKKSKCLNWGIINEKIKKWRCYGFKIGQNKRPFIWWSRQTENARHSLITKK